MGPKAISDIAVLFFHIKDVFKITKIIEPTGCFNQNHVSLGFDDYEWSLQWKRLSAGRTVPPSGPKASSQIRIFPIFTVFLKA